MTLPSHLFRRFALALATAQLVAFAAAPVVEGTVAVAQMGVGLSVDGGTSDRSVPTHDPSTCVACQLLSSVAALPQPATILVPDGDASGRERLLVDVPRQVFARQGFLSRAPPTLPA